MSKFGPGANTGKTFPVEILTSDEVRMLIKATSKRGLCGVRDRALIATLYRAGLRISEALHLFPKDVNFDDATITVLRAKGDKPGKPRRRVVGADVETVALIRHWIDVRKSHGISGHAPLFCTLKGTPMIRHQVNDHLKALAEKAGIEKRVHPHAMRHTFASELVDEKVDIRVVQAALGHFSLATTEKYIRHLKNKAVVVTMHEREWKP